MLKVINRTCQQLNKMSGIRCLSDQVNETRGIEKTINQICLLGRVGADPQEKGSREHPLVVFSLATHTNYKNESDNYIQRTDWHRICVFRPSLRDTVINYLKKGQRVLVQGRLNYGKIKNDNGDEVQTTAIIADDVIFFQNGQSS